MSRVSSEPSDYEAKGHIVANLIFAWRKPDHDPLGFSLSGAKLDRYEIDALVIFNDSVDEKWGVITAVLTVDGNSRCNALGKLRDFIRPNEMGEMTQGTSACPALQEFFQSIVMKVRFLAYVPKIGVRSKPRLVTSMARLVR